MINPVISTAATSDQASDAVPTSHAPHAAPPGEDSTMSPQPTVRTASTVRAAQAARARQRRHRAGETRSTLVDLTALGCFLATLDERQLAAFVAVVGEDVARRALWAASLVVTTEVERPVAG